MSGHLTIELQRITEQFSTTFKAQMNLKAAKENQHPSVISSIVQILQHIKAELTEKDLNEVIQQAGIALKPELAKEKAPPAIEEPANTKRVMNQMVQIHRI